MTFLVIAIFVLLNIGLVSLAYFAFLRKLSPIPGYAALASLIAVLAVVDVFSYDSVSSLFRRSRIEEISPEQCTKEYVQKVFNQLSKPDETLDKEMLAEQILQCFDDTKQTILVRQIAESTSIGQPIVFSAQPLKVPLEKYIRGLHKLSIGDSIHVDLIENNSAGLIMYLEISEKQYKKK